MGFMRLIFELSTKSEPGKNRIKNFSQKNKNRIVEKYYGKC
jgi:hypothetical protein